jgi:hypothetical protein
VQDRHHRAISRPRHMQNGFSLGHVCLHHGKVGISTEKTFFYAPPGDFIKKFVKRHFSDVISCLN